MSRFHFSHESAAKLRLEFAHDQSNGGAGFHKRTWSIHMAKKLGVDKKTILDILNNRTWTFAPRMHYRKAPPNYDAFLVGLPCDTSIDLDDIWLTVDEWFAKNPSM